jgi:hypothetical protein
MTRQLTSTCSFVQSSIVKLLLFKLNNPSIPFDNGASAIHFSYMRPHLPVNAGTRHAYATRISLARAEEQNIPKKYANVIRGPSRISCLTIRAYVLNISTCKVLNEG